MNYIEIKNILTQIQDPVLKLEFIMDVGSHMDAVPAKAVCNEIQGCASRAEICRVNNNFYGSADSALVRGIVAILVAMVNEKSPDEIKKMDLNSEFLSLDIALGTGRLAGVNSMISFLQNL